MTRIELVYDCNHYKGGEDKFSEIISGFLKLDEGNEALLANQFHLLAPRTVQDWSFGYVNPTSSVRCAVVNAIKKKLAEESHLRVL